MRSYKQTKTHLALHTSSSPYTPQIAQGNREWGLRSVHDASSPPLLQGHYLPLLQHGIPPMGCRPIQTDPVCASHRQQLFNNCSYMGPNRGVHLSGANCCPTGSSSPQIPRSPAPVGALHGPQPPPGHIHLLHRGLLHGLWCGDLLCHGTHGLQVLSVCSCPVGPTNMHVESECTQRSFN